MEKRKELELYVHIPFCVKKCAYCDFLSAPADEEKRQEYVETLVREIEGHREQYREYRVTTIFVGGGTPSILSAAQMECIFASLRENFLIEENAEITIEVNPGTVTVEKADAWKRAGINRISIGLQTVNDEELRMLGRIHTFEQFLETYYLLRKKGFMNLNVDLISAIPGQTQDSWRKTLCTVAELEPEHISAYSLIVEEGTSFYKLYGDDKDRDRDVDTSETTAVSERYRVCGSVKSELKEREYLPLPNEDVERAIYEETEKLLQQYGYNRYEISNYAKKGYACRHNEGYWRRKEYLGIGLGASSLIGKQRYRNLSRYDEYIDAVQNRTDIHEETEYLEKTNEMEEFMFLGLRMMEGVSRTKFYENFEKEIEEVYGEQLMRLAGDGLIRSDEERIELTKRGIDISNYVFEQFLLE
ncbi:radical SAM family heme chaperone HemW [Mediterraneibacter agrestimuris]|uniref:radical SAM family heme chaperone HemW n=1 Tax=Mediterraneibacter agrestimuris TaxID=2941333 RepID=UPI00203D78EA|nr:radical SAM family heme chaperone HemW [Mediterraneibacter agrestimuris]